MPRSRKVTGYSAPTGLRDDRGIQRRPALISQPAQAGAGRTVQAADRGRQVSSLSGGPFIEPLTRSHHDRQQIRQPVRHLQRLAKPYGHLQVQRRTRDHIHRRGQARQVDVHPSSMPPTGTTDDHRHGAAGMRSEVKSAGSADAGTRSGQTSKRRANMAPNRLPRGRIGGVKPQVRTGAPPGT
jgi:hypothetical protein